MVDRQAYQHCNREYGEADKVEYWKVHRHEGQLDQHQRLLRAATQHVHVVTNLRCHQHCVQQQHSL